MTQKQSKPRRSLPVVKAVPPFPPFDPKEVPPKPKLYALMVKAVTKKVLHAPFSMHTYMALRRTVLPQILPDELLYRWKPYRRGECSRCGECCRIQFECPFVVEDDGPNVTHCAIYQIDSAPKACHTFPIDPLDLHMLQREVGYVCTFHFEGEPEPLPRFEYFKMVAKHLWSRRRGRKRRPALETGE
jgi:hypothetical protein